MKILVTVKRVTDYEARLKIKPSGEGIETDGVNMISNPFDEIAVEEALRLVEKHGGEVCVVSVGASEAATQIRSALAMGADRGGRGGRLNFWQRLALVAGADLLIGKARIPTASRGGEEDVFE